MNSNKHIDNLKSTIDKFEQELNNYKLTNEKLMTDLQESKINQQLILSNNEESYLTEQIESLNSKLNSIDEIRQQIENQNIELFSELESFKSESICSNTFQDSSVSVDLLLVKNENIENELKNNIQIINNLEIKVEELILNKKQAEIDIIRLDKDKQIIEEAKANVELQLFNEIEIRKALVDKYENDKHKLLVELNESKNKQDCLNKQIGSLKTQLNDLLTIMDNESDSKSKDESKLSKIDRKKLKKNYILNLENKIENLNGEIVSLKNLISLYKTDNEKLKQENSIFLKSSSPNSSSNKSQPIIQNKIIELEQTNEELKQKLISFEVQANKENELQSDLINSLRSLIAKLEREQINSQKTYEDLIKSQKILITKLEIRYTDVLNYVFEEMIGSNGNIDELQNDLISIYNKEQEYNDNYIEDSLVDADDDSSFFNNTTNKSAQVKQLIKQYTNKYKSTASLDAVADEFNFDSESYFSQLLLENNIKQDNQLVYFSQIHNIKDLLSVYTSLAISNTNDLNKLENLKKAYQTLYTLYESFKTKSFATYNNLHREYLILVYSCCSVL